jgi:hypothetical protein
MQYLTSPFFLLVSMEMEWELLQRHGGHHTSVLASEPSGTSELDTNVNDNWVDEPMDTTLDDNNTTHQDLIEEFCQNQPQGYRCSQQFFFFFFHVHIF